MKFSVRSLEHWSNLSNIRATWPGTYGRGGAAVNGSGILELLPIPAPSFVPTPIPRRGVFPIF